MNDALETARSPRVTSNEGVWRRACRDTLRARGSFRFWLYEVLAGTVVGTLTKNPYAAFSALLGAFVLMFLWNLLQAPIRQRDEVQAELRAATVEQKDILDWLRGETATVGGVTLSFDVLVRTLAPQLAVGVSDHGVRSIVTRTFVAHGADEKDATNEWQNVYMWFTLRVLRKGVIESFRESRETVGGKTEHDICWRFTTLGHGINASYED